MRVTEIDENTPNVTEVVYYNMCIKWTGFTQDLSGADPGIFVRGGPTFRKNFDKQKKKKKKKKNDKRGEGGIQYLFCISMVEI